MIDWSGDAAEQVEMVGTEEAVGWISERRGSEILGLQRRFVDEVVAASGLCFAATGCHEFLGYCFDASNPAKEKNRHNQIVIYVINLLAGALLK